MDLLGSRFPPIFLLKYSFCFEAFSQTPNNNSNFVWQQQERPLSDVLGGSRIRFIWRISVTRTAKDTLTRLSLQLQIDLVPRRTLPLGSPSPLPRPSPPPSPRPDDGQLREGEEHQ